MKKYLLVFLVLIVATDAFAQFTRTRQRAAVGGDNLNYANPAQYTIAGIDVTGLTILDKNAIISLSGLRVGDQIKIPGDAISDAIRKLWDHGLVGDVSIRVSQIDGDNVYLVIVLTERPRLTAFYFTGIGKAAQSSLKDEMKLIRGKIVNDAMIRNAELTVKKHYLKKGFLNTDVKIYQEKDTLNEDGIRLRIDVRPNAKIRIHRINLTGNVEVADSKLKKKLKKTKEYARMTLHRAILRELIHHPEDLVYMGDKVTWPQVKEFLSKNVKLNFLSGSKYIPTDFDADKKKLIDFYNSKGYRDADILSDTIEKYDQKSIDVDISLVEGPKYYIRNITWKGNYIYTDKQLSAVLGIKKGDVYNKELLDRRLHFDPKGGEDVSGLYLDDGYLFFNVDPVESVTEGDSIDIEMRITEGEQATIDEVTISGNDRTSDHVIRREMTTLPGQKFRRSDIIRTQQRLGTLGYFDATKVTPDIQPKPQTGKVDVGWKVVEQSSDQVQLSGGWGGYYGFVGTLGLTFNNFSVRNIPHPRKWKYLPMGDGQHLSIEAQANGRNFQNYSISFTEPWLGGHKPQSLTISANKAISRYPGFGATSYTDLNSHLKLDNITVGLGRQLRWPDDFFTLSNSLSYSVYTLKNIDYGAGCTDCTFNSITVNTTLNRTSIDNPRYPASGSIISLSATLSPPYSLWRNIDYATATAQEKNKWVEYHKWMFDSKFYLALDNAKKLVIEAKAHFGFIGSYTKKVGIGPFERFYLGGSGLAGGFNSFVLGQEVIGLRGYDDNQITPPYNYSGTTQPIRGGIVYDKFGLELRYPFANSGATTVYGFVFTEAGNNWYNYTDFNPFSMYKSAGLGIRLNMPAFGLIGINWAYGFDPFPLNSGGNPSGSHFHFTIGEQIR